VAATELAVEAALEVHQAAEAEESFDVLIAVEGAEHAGEIVGGGDLRAEAAAERLAVGTAPQVVVATRAGRFGHELELAGASLELDHRPGRVGEVERFAIDAGVEIRERLLEPHEVLVTHRRGDVEPVGQLARAANDAGRSTFTAYRVAIDDLLDWSGHHGRNVFEEATIVDHLAAYERRAQPAPATYYRRFGLLRRFMRWLSRRNGLPDPFLELEPPPKPQQEADWLTEDEFARLLAAAEHPRRRRDGLAERDRLVLLTLVQTGLRRSELIALNWSDLELDGPRPSLLVRCGKGRKPRRQPLVPTVAAELARLRAAREAPADAPVFCGLEGKRRQPTILAAIIRRAAEGAGLEKRVTAHTLRHTAATWLRQQTGDARLVAAYLGHADLSTVSRYAHVAEAELYEAAATLAKRVENTPRRRAA
jgi:integrase/recombinase XerC